MLLAAGKIPLYIYAPRGGTRLFRANLEVRVSVPKFVSLMAKSLVERMVYEQTVILETWHE